MAVQSPDEVTRAHGARIRSSQSALGERHCTICCEEYEGYVLTPCCLERLCVGCAQKVYEGSAFLDVLSEPGAENVIAIGHRCPYCRAAWDAPPADVVPVSEDRCQRCGWKDVNGSSSDFNADKFLARCEWCHRVVCGTCQFQLGTTICKSCWPEYETCCFWCQEAMPIKECDVCDELTCVACAIVMHGEWRYTCERCVLVEQRLEESAAGRAFYTMILDLNGRGCL